MKMNFSLDLFCFFYFGSSFWKCLSDLQEIYAGLPQTVANAQQNVCIQISGVINFSLPVLKFLLFFSVYLK
jgi:hypothetical protein